MQTSCAFLTLLIAVVGISPAFAQDAEQRRLDAIAREAARQFAEARNAAPAERRREPGWS